MPPRSHRSRRSRRPRQLRRAGRRWGWIGFGALLAAAATVLSLRRSPSRALVAGPLAAPKPPDDAGDCWIAGPAGTLRVLERHPSGELPVVFVHGLGGNARHWSLQLEATGPAIRAVAFDLPGHGGSDLAADGDYSIPATAAAIGAVLDAFRLRRAVLVAHSLGAAAAIEYAGTHRHRVAGLLLVDPSGDQTRLPEAHHRDLFAQLRRDPGEEIRWYFRQLLTGARAEVAHQVLEDLATVPAEVVLSALEGGASYSPLPAFERFAGPARALISDLNDLSYSLHRLLPDLPVVRFRQASHWLMLDRPAELWAVLVDFLDEVESRARKSGRGPKRKTEKL